MATKLIALNSNNFLRWSGDSYHRLALSAKTRLRSSAEIAKQGRFRHLSGLAEFAALFYEKKTFCEFFTNQTSVSRFNQCRFPSFCIDLMDGLATLDASCLPVATEVYF
jgi:hypothetical protein